MNKVQMQDMVLAILMHADYDLWKSYNEETSEDPECVEENMNELIEIVQKHLKKSEKKKKKTK